MITDQKPFTTAEAAALLQCEPETVEDWLRQGKLCGIKAGRSWVLPRSAFFARLDELAMEEAANRRAPAPVSAQTREPLPSSAQRARGRRARALPQLVQLGR